jgi:hypothetical protein
MNPEKTLAAGPERPSTNGVGSANSTDSQPATRNLPENHRIRGRAPGTVAKSGQKRPKAAKSGQKWPRSFGFRIQLHDCDESISRLCRATQRFVMKPVGAAAHSINSQPSEDTRSCCQSCTNCCLRCGALPSLFTGRFWHKRLLAFDPDSAITLVAARDMEPS